MFEHLEKHYLRDSVPSGVREIVRRAIEVVTAEGISVTDDSNAKDASLSAAGKNKAVYVGKTRLSVYLDPDAATRALDADPALVLAKESAASWVVRAPFADLTDSGRAGRMESLAVEGLRRSALGRRASAPRSARADQAATTEPVAVRPTAPIPGRCASPGCNLPLFDGTCGFH